MNSYLSGEATRGPSITVDKTMIWVGVITIKYSTIAIAGESLDIMYNLINICL